MIRRLLLAIAFSPVAIALGRLARFPGYAASNGLPGGAALPMATISVAIAALVLVCAVILAWRVADHVPRLVAVLPIAAALVVVSLRRIATWGMSEKLYLLDDTNSWIVLLVATILLSTLVAMMPADSRKAVHDNVAAPDRDIVA